ncbi:MAG: methyltransferase domain-containing protein [Deltaproteobacteria bacterium]|nr:methyltransferase domain-containing protein [Deltaproteobacteria bacterium]
MPEADVGGAARDDGGRFVVDEHDLPAGPLDLGHELRCRPPVDLDIGFGKGRSLLEWSTKGFGGTLLGVEIRRSFVEHAAARLAKAGVCDVRIVRGDFRALVPRLGPAGAVRRCFLHFPDPWWKKRHQKRQVVSAPVVASIVGLLAQGGEVFVQTDVPERAEEFERILSSGGLDTARCAEGPAAPNPFGTRSNREVRCEEAGLPVYRVIGRKP